MPNYELVNLMGNRDLYFLKKVSAMVCDIFLLSANQWALFMCVNDSTNYNRKSCFATPGHVFSSNNQ